MATTTVPDYPVRNGSGDRGVPAHAKTGFWPLAFGSIGVVYGDIGTSPLYALKESLVAAAAGGALTREMVFGVVSLILWALIVIVTLKYVVLILRDGQQRRGRHADPDGARAARDGPQGCPGHFARHDRRGAVLRRRHHHARDLGALGRRGAQARHARARALRLAAEPRDPGRRSSPCRAAGTAAVAAWFGPITTVWFVAMAVGGLAHLADEPSILAAISPTYGVRFLLDHGVAGLFALGAVFLAVTGAEALYADMGHFGRRPIQFAWFALVLPALALNYLGQGALLLTYPEKLENPFYLLYPDWALLPMVVLASMATIIASQAVIYRRVLAHPAGDPARLAAAVRDPAHLRDREGPDLHPAHQLAPAAGAVVFLVIVFRSSSALAAAYGIAVTGTMVVTAILAFFVLWQCWKWSVAVAALADRSVPRHRPGVPARQPAQGLRGRLDAARGRRLAAGRDADLAQGRAHPRREGAARRRCPLPSSSRCWRSARPSACKARRCSSPAAPTTCPAALLHNLKHNKVLHQQNVILSVTTEDTPRVGAGGPGIHRAALGRLLAGDAPVRVHGDAEHPQGAAGVPQPWAGSST